MTVAKFTGYLSDWIKHRVNYLLSCEGHVVLEECGHEGVIKD